MVMMEEENSGYILTAILCYFCCCLILYDVTICIKVLDNVKQLFHKMMLLKIIICRHEKKTQKMCDVSQEFPEERYVRLHDERSMAGINQGHRSYVNDPTKILVGKYTRHALYENENDNGYAEILLFHIPDRQDNSKCSWTVYNGRSEKVRTRSFNDDAFIRLCILLSQLKNGFLENIMNLKFEQVTQINRGIKYTLLWLNSLITDTLWQLLDVVFGSNETNMRQGMRNIYLLFLHECRKEAKRVRLFGIKSTNMGRIVESEKDFVPRTIISEKCFVYKTSVFETLFPKMTNCDGTCRLKSFKIILMSRPEICVLQRFTQEWKDIVCRGWKSQFKSNKSQSNDGETSIEMNLQDTSGPVSMKTKGEIKKQKYLQLTNTTKCQLCTNRNRAVNWCNTCQMNICSFCKLYHQRVWDVMDHDIHPLRETY